MPWVLGLVVVGVIVLAILWAFGSSSGLSKAEVEKILAAFPSVHGRDMSAAERAIRKRCGADSPDAMLMYALRISLPARTVKRLPTLAARWGTTWEGAGGAGLSAGRSSAHFERVSGYLERLYVRRAADLAEDIIERARESEAKRKSDRAKENVWEKAMDKIVDGFAEFYMQPSGLGETQRAAVASCQASLDRLQGGAPSPGAGIRVGVPTASPVSSSRSAAPVRRRGAKASVRWIPPGEPVTVHGLPLPGGMLYVGDHLDSLCYGAVPDPSLIDPSLPIDMPHADRDGDGLNYWPSYTQLAPATRAGYLGWLAAGRRRPDTPIGFVFLFFYGLERRILHDRRETPIAQDELRAIAEELTQLLQVYGSQSGSFHSYASDFLTVVQLLGGAEPAATSDELQDLPGFGGSGHLWLQLGTHAREKKPLPPIAALAWTMTTDVGGLRTPATRCWRLFRELFGFRYQEAFGDGVTPRARSKSLTLPYQPASATFGEAQSIAFGDVPGVVADRRLMNKIQAVVESCEDELDPYSRWIGRKGNSPDDMAAVALLPGPVFDRHGNADALALFQRLDLLLGNDGSAVTDGAALVERWPSKKPDRLAKREGVALAQLLERRGFGVEPDVRFGGKPLRTGEPVVVFRVEPGAPDAPSADYTAVARLMHLASAVAASDSTSEVEERHLEQRLENTMNLSDAERVRLAAHVRWLLEARPSFSGLKRHLETLPEAQRRSIARFCIAVAGADGRIDPSEIKSLEKVYKVLGIPSGDVYGDLHELASGESTSATAPVEVRPAGAKAAGYAVPAPPPSEVASKGVTLDPERLRETLAETAEVQALLAGIFVEEEHPPPSTVAVPAAPESTAFQGLGGAHAALLTQLGAQGRWTREEYEGAAEQLGLLPDGAFETINEASFEVVGDPVLFGSDPIEVDAEVLEELKS